MLAQHETSMRRSVLADVAQSRSASGQPMTASDSTHSVREDWALYNAAGDPHLFPTDTFVGCGAELRTLREAIDTNPHRLITVAGPAGVGKTRLALEALRTADEHYPGGAVIVRLAAIERVNDIVPEIARALGMLDQAEKLDELVREALAGAPTILLLDCFEHLTPEANGLIGGLLRDCPRLRIVLTTRRPSTLPGEWCLELHPLPVARAKTNDAALKSEAVRLFIDRARKARDWFTLNAGDAEIINELCARYNGLPLAIELLASWTTVLSLKELLEWKPEDLEYRMPVQDPRHQSLLDAIAWSYGLLPPDAQTLMLRLSIFTGGFSRDLAEKMAQGREAGAGYPYADGYPAPWTFAIEGLVDPTGQRQDPEIARPLAPISSSAVRTLATLIDHRLVYQSGEIDGVPRFDMLEAFREFGHYQLERSGQIFAVRHAHAAAMVAFCEAGAEGFWHKEVRFWPRERIDADLQNVRAALAWATLVGDDASELGIRLSGPLWNYWQTRGLVTEGRSAVASWIFRPSVPEWCRCTNAPGFAFLCWIQGDDASCQEVVDWTLAIPVISRYFSAEAMIYLVMALLEFRRGLENVLTMMEYVEHAEQLFDRAGDVNGKGACYLIYGQVCRLTGDTARALELFDESRDLLTESGYEWGVAASRYFAAEVTRDLAETDPLQVTRAVVLLNESLEQFWFMGDFWGAGGAMSGLACVLAMQGADLQAATYFGAASVLMNRVGGSLLPSELMTHQETEAELQARMPPAVWREAYALGQSNPDRIVEQALADAAQSPTSFPATQQPRLTRTQLSIVQDLVQGYDIPRIAQRRGRSLSATYELVDRILDKLDLTDRGDIAPSAIKLGLVAPPQARPGFIPPQ